MVVFTERCPESESMRTLFLSKQRRLISIWLELWSRLRPIQSQFGWLLSLNTINAIYSVQTK